MSFNIGVWYWNGCNIGLSFDIGVQYRNGFCYKGVILEWVFILGCSTETGFATWVWYWNEFLYWGCNIETSFATWVWYWNVFWYWGVVLKRVLLHGCDIGISFDIECITETSFATLVWYWNEFWYHTNVLIASVTDIPLLDLYNSGVVMFQISFRKTRQNRQTGGPTQWTNIMAWHIQHWRCDVSNLFPEDPAK